MRITRRLDFKFKTEPYWILFFSLAPLLAMVIAFFIYWIVG